MICVTLHHKSFGELVDILERPDIAMAEIRLDSCPLDDSQTAELFGMSDTPLIATCRYSSCPEDAEGLLAAAIEAGAAYVDIELDAPAPMSKRLCRLAREKGTAVIRSFHDEGGTPPEEQLRGIYDKCCRFGADVVKIVTMAAGPSDWETLGRLYIAPAEEAKVKPLVAFCMGESESRTDCLALGAPFTYACLEEGDEAAAGQIPYREMSARIYGSRTPYVREGLRMPASKSFVQRAILAAALAEGTSRLEGYSPCADSEAALGAARSLGAGISIAEDGALEIRGIGPLEGKLDIPRMNAGESGLLARLLIPVCAAISGSPTVIEGEKTLLSRPLQGANDIMAPFGVILCGASKGTKIPVTVTGNLLPGKAEISGLSGSQLISGLLMALPLTDRGSTVYVQDPKSIPYMFITLDVLRRFGISITNEMEGDEEFVATGDWSLCTQTNFKIKAPQQYKAASFRIESDWSAAANYLVAGAVFGAVSIDGLSGDSLQADLSIIDILVDVGAMASQDEDGRINVRRGPLRGISTDLSNAPDLFPIVSVLACFCGGVTRLKGVQRLCSKESDRAAAILETLGKMGVEANVEADEMVIAGLTLEQRLLTGRLLRGGEYSSFHDHRMLMALKVASLGAASRIIIDDEECVAKSYPGFKL